MKAKKEITISGQMEMMARTGHNGEDRTDKHGLFYNASQKLLSSKKSSFKLHLQRAHLLVLMIIIFITVIFSSQVWLHPGARELSLSGQNNNSIPYSCLFPAENQMPLNLSQSLASASQESAITSLREKLHDFLVKKAGPGKAEKFKEAFKPIISSEAFDLYLLNFWLKGKPLEALFLISLKLQEAPDESGLLNNAGALLCSINQFQLAYDFLQQAQLLSPDNPGILNNLGVAAYGLGQVKEACHFFQKTLELDSFHPEAGYSLYLLDSATVPPEKNRTWLQTALKGGFRETMAKKTQDFPLPLSFQQEIFLSLPLLPPSFLEYKNLTSFYQKAFLKMEEKESELQKKLDTVLSSGFKRAETETGDKSTFHLTSILAYSQLLELEGQLDRLEREVERPADMDLEQIISQTISKLESIFRDYAKEEKACLEASRAERADCLKKARENYCQTYREQAEDNYQKYKTSLESYFKKVEPELKNFLTGFYFWVRYLPEDQQRRKRAETELRVWKLYQGLWEKSFQLLARLGEPAFPECFPVASLIPESTPEPEISLSDPFSEINLNYNAGSFSFSLFADRIIISDRQSQIEFPLEKFFSCSTIHLYPPESSGARPVYLVVDNRGKLNDLGELGPWAFFGLSSSNRWRIFISLSLPSSDKNQ